MKRLFAITFLSLSVHACVIDTVYNCKIKNNSPNNIEVKIFFDKTFLDSIYNGQKYKYISFLKETIGQDSGVSMINFDSLNLTVSYKILPRTIFTLEHGMSGPDYAFYKNIIIIGKDTVEFHNKQEIDESFKKIDGEYLLTID